MKDDPKSEDNFKNKDILKIEDDFKYEDLLKYEELKMKRTSIWRQPQIGRQPKKQRWLQKWRGPQNEKNLKNCFPLIFSVPPISHKTAAWIDKIMEKSGFEQWAGIFNICMNTVIIFLLRSFLSYFKAIFSYFLEGNDNKDNKGDIYREWSQL